MAVGAYDTRTGRGCGGFTMSSAIDLPDRIDSIAWRDV